jgi:H+/gluconate symporter-like permease
VVEKMKKIFEAIVLAGVIIGFGVIFVIEAIDLFIIRPIYQKFFKKRRRRKRG